MAQNVRFVVISNQIPAYVAAVATAAKLLPKEITASAAEEMRSLVPVDTGALRDSILNSDNTVEAGGADAHYGFFVNFGTHKMPANPFFSMAIGHARTNFFGQASGVLHFRGRRSRRGKRLQRMKG
jgi:HK97 gp10 family phage protein